MQPVGWIQRLLASTRGEIIRLLRRSSRTVTELAEALGVTDNAVRTHLSALERDGLVRQEEAVPRGVGKPPFVYSLTPQADTLLPKAYAPALGILLGLLEERLGAAEVEGLLREAGRRAAAGRVPAGADVRARLGAALGVLEELGGVVEVEERDGTAYVRGFSCPLAAVVPDHPEACSLAESLMTELVGVPVRERCDKGESPHCCFEVPLERAAGR
ncbi:MAG TPA: ArsR family transcriptional regulator [Longimicrobiaceae bacterium]|nr:ArsR family transcriptional regulator [Longimicrobiaceae bacterium]